jgi:NAD(P)-dependent dehydrogenase (short-subunit alcohol dehydrogenase family)
MAPALKVKENITINAVCPGIVETPIIPPELIAAVSREWWVLPLPPDPIADE